MTQHTGRGIAYPAGGDDVAVHTDVQATAVTTDTAIAEAETRALAAVTTLTAQVDPSSLVRSAVPVGEPAIAITFADGSRSALEVGADGAPTALSAALHVAAEAPGMGVALGVETPPGAIVPALGDVAAVWAFEDGSVAAAITLDGALVTPGGVTASAWPATAYGDSTTYGEDLTSPSTQSWPVLLATLTGRAVVNRGLSGSRSAEIAARAGAVTVAGQTASVPATGAATITGLTPDPWAAGPGEVLDVLALTDTTAQVLGTLARAATPGTATLTRTTPGIATGATTLAIRARPALGSRLLLVGMGVNDGPGIIAGTTTLADVQAVYRAVTTAHTGPLVVWGVLDRGVSEAAGTVIGDYIRALEAWCAITYGDAWCPVRAYLATARALDDAGITPTAADTAAITAGTVPPSLRVAAGSVHLNAAGHQLQARYIHRHLLLRGLI